jgi:hypothetical protein
MSATEKPSRFPKWPTLVAWGLFVLITLYIGFRSPPLSPSSIICLLLAYAAATAIAMIPFWLDYRLEKLEIEDRKTKISDNLRAAMDKSEGMVARLAALEKDSAKGILIARQLPDRLEEKLAVLDQMMTKQETDRFRQLNHDLELLRQTDVQALTKVAESIREFTETVVQTRAGTPHSTEIDFTPLMEKLDALSSPQIVLEDKVIQAAIDEALKGATDFETGVLKEQADALQRIRENISTLIGDIRSEYRRQVKQLDERLKESSVLSNVESVKKEKPVPVVEKPKTTPKQKPEEQIDMGLDFGDSTERKIDPDSVALEVEAMVGISNKVFIRGDEPYLSWDVGVPLEMSGIGHWSWKADNIKEPIKVLLLKNDDDEDLTNREIILEPGSFKKVKATF